MARDSKPTKTRFERRAVELRERALRMCKGDCEQATSLLMNTIIELLSKPDSAVAARALYQLSDLAKQAAQHQTTITQIKALEIELFNATTDEERERIARDIRQKMPSAPSAQAQRINTIVQQHQLHALYAHRRTAATSEDRQQLDDHIARLQASSTES